jgi:hypothetical protein
MSAVCNISAADNGNLNFFFHYNYSFILSILTIFLSREILISEISRSESLSEKEAMIFSFHADCSEEAIELLRRKLNQRNVYCMNPAIDL